MFEEFSIAARDHGAGVAQQAGHGVTCGRGLPFMPTDLPGAEQDLRDVLLRGAVPRAVEGLQHAACASALLACQSRVRRNRTAIQRGEQPMHGLQSTEPV